MSSITGDTLANLGGALNDYSPVIDATTDLPAAAGNTAMADTAAMTRTRWAAWVRFQTAGIDAPSLVSHAELWGAVSGIAVPTVTRSGVGVYVVTWPAIVQDEIPAGSPGYSGPVGLNLQNGIGNSEGGTTFYDAKVVITSPNVATVYLWSGASPPALVDPSNVTFGVWVN